MPEATGEASAVVDSVPQPAPSAANTDLNHVTAARARPRLGRRPPLSSVRRKQFQSSRHELQEELEPTATDSDRCQDLLRLKVIPLVFVEEVVFKD